MKKLLLTTAAFAFVASAFAQGTVVFSTRLTASTTPYYSQVYLPDASNPGVQVTGNTANNLPAGTQTYSGAAITGGYLAQVFSIPGSTLPVGPFTAYGVTIGSDPFAAAAPTSTFRTGTSAGSIALTTATLANVAKDAASAVLQVRVWPSTFADWGSAVAAWNLNQPGVFIGASPAFIVNLIGGDVNTPPQLTGVSFSLVAAPEPSSFALAGLGMASLLIFRRRK